MFSRHKLLMYKGLRLSRSLSLIREGSTNPTLRSNLFSSKSLPAQITSIPLNTYPNPLFGLEKNDILRLSGSELQHLLKIPYKSTCETDKFCYNVIEIIHENILENPSLAARFIHTIKDPEMKDIIMTCLTHYYESDRLRRSILLFMQNPGGSETKREILCNIDHILSRYSESPSQAANMVLNYLRKLAQTGSVNPNVILLSGEHASQLMANINSSDQATLFACLFHTNIKFKDNQKFEQFKRKLLAGSLIEKTVARTGILDAKWHDTNRFSFSAEHKRKMVYYFTFNDLVFFTQHAIKEKDVVNANLYLDLLVTKFENTKDVSNQPKQLQLVLTILLNHSMRFIGPQECLKFLRYMVESKIQVRPATLLRLLMRFREDKCYEEALLLINFLHTTSLDQAQRKLLVKEIMLVISAKFSHHPRIAIGYFASLFSGENDKALKCLQDLGLLELVYGQDVFDTSFSVIERADLHEDLKGSELTHDTLKDIYSIVLRNLTPEKKSGPLVQHLFTQYLKQVKKAQENDDKKSLFHPNAIDDSIISLFMDHLLRQNPYSTSDMDLNSDKLNYTCATSMWRDFFGQVDLSRNQRKPYLVDLMISACLLKHRDLSFAGYVMKQSRQIGLPLSFNQLFPFIMFHYSNGDYNKAHQWYLLLLQNGVKSKSIAAKKLFEIARELKWDVKGTYYRSSSYARNKRAKKELAKLATNQSNYSKTKNVAHKPAHDPNLFDELGALLNAIPKNEG
ncbi:hypothetical protein FOB63_004698 [Clavispora lusitaniae]|uniref:uncharacterized protein n=1 Tax=Clavispora lusitaniae TaxID=36911 RepID=UPI00202C5CD4|nr:hypothetical protein FOB63_004698 [Clavispora lusitaniae]